MALDLDEDAALLDMACGGGRHALELARRGYSVEGVDCQRHAGGLRHAPRL